MIWRLLRKNISISQIAGYALANLIGLAIVMSAIRFYGDVKTVISGGDSDENDSVVSADYLVISKPVSMMNTITGARGGFSPSDIRDIEEQPWATAAAPFVSADFRVSASVELGGAGMSSFLFLESIPDEFIDVKPRGWRFDPGEGTDGVVPIIISKDYLALYNFGFAGSRGLPQLSEGIISEVPIMLRLSGNGRSDVMRAKIVGFSSRLNTIAVPEDFMAWANDRYSASPSERPSRLIIKVAKPGDPAIKQYLADNGYEAAGDKLDTGRASYFLTLLTTIVIAIGAVISLLALFILMLSIFLLMQKSREKITDLLLLGYSPMQVAKGYFKLIGAVNVSVLALATAIMLTVSAMWEKSLASLSIKATSPMAAIIAGAAIILVITAINYGAIYRSVRRAF